LDGWKILRRKWILEENEYYNGFREIYGFQPYYDSYYPDEEYKNIYAVLDTNSPIDIAGFDTFFKINIYSDTNTKEQQITTFKQGENTYTIKQNTDDKGELIITVFDENEQSIMEIPMNEFFNKISKKASEPKAIMSAKDLTFDKNNAKLNIRLIVDNMNIENPEGEKMWVSGTIYVFVTTP